MKILLSLPKRRKGGTETLPQCPFNEHRCEFNVGDNECGRIWVCKRNKYYKNCKK